MTKMAQDQSVYSIVSTGAVASIPLCLVWTDERQDRSSCGVIETHCFVVHRCINVLIRTFKE